MFNMNLVIHMVRYVVYTHFIDILGHVESRPSAVVSSLVVEAADEFHRLEEDVLGIHQLGIIPGRVVIHVLFG